MFAYGSFTYDVYVYSSNLDFLPFFIFHRSVDPGMIGDLDPENM